VRDIDGLQATSTLGPVNRVGPDLSASLELIITVPMPAQDEHLPETIAAHVHAAGREVQRPLFRALIAKADRELVLEGRDGKRGEGILRRGTRPLTFKTLVDAVTVERCRISPQRDGAMAIPSSRAWNTPHQLAITGNLRDAVGDRRSEQSSGTSLEEIGEQAGDADLLGRSTVIAIVHEQGGRRIAAQRQRARAILDGASEAERAALGPSLAHEPDRMAAHEPDDDPRFDPADPEWQPTPPPEWVVTGFPGCDPSPPVPREEPRAVDDAVVIVEPDEVTTKAQPSTGRQEIWTDTAVVLVAGLRYALADATTEGLWVQVAALLLEWEVLSGGRRLLVLGDGASWIRTWFESLGIDPRAMIVCWWHHRKRCDENLNSAGGPKDRRQALSKSLLDRLWEGKVDEAIGLLREAPEWVRTAKALEDLIGYLEKRRAYLPDYGERQRVGLWIASTRVEQFNDGAVSARCKHRGMSWSAEGVLAVATLEAARQNDELDFWRRSGVLPKRPLPDPVRKAA
jgi:hypothetical protein